MTRTVTVVEAKEHFDQLLDNLVSGEDEIIIALDGTPVARLMPVASSPSLRTPGCDAGKFVIPESFFQPLPTEFVDEFYR